MRLSKYYFFPMNLSMYLIAHLSHHFLPQLTPDKCKTLLIQAICQILMKCKSSKYRIVSLRANRQAAAGSGAGGCPSSSAAALPEEIDGDAEMVDALENVPSHEQLELGVDAAMTATAAASDLVNQNTMEEGAASGATAEALEGAADQLNPETFHERLCVSELEQIDDVEKYYAGNFHVLADECGVLLLLYTVLLTKVGISELG